MTKKKKQEKKKYFVLVTFDLKKKKLPKDSFDIEALNGKASNARRKVHDALKGLNLHKAIAKRDGTYNKGITHNTFSGVFTEAQIPDPKAFIRQLREQIRAIIEKEGIAGRVMAVITDTALWASAKFPAPK
ncbi:hypothetical protein [Achromobacter insuavis]|uniref:hypothetical protein n=1 Tax=Achromobacter insuavis TaxID=1287735 RepID=UPI001F13362B|nr:hypothetical protein [Achromobacter insuavis]